MAAERISVEQARRNLESEKNPLLVCAYEEDEKFEKNHLEGALSLSDFRSMQGTIPKSREIIFYCA